MSPDASRDALHPAKHALAGAVDVRPQRSAGIRWLALIALLFALVFIAHLLALDLASGQFGIDKPVQTTAFSTRMIEPPPAVPAAPAKAAPVVTKPVRMLPKVKPTPPASPPKPVQSTSVLASETPNPPVATATPESGTAEPAPAQTEPEATLPQLASAESGQPPPAFTSPSSVKLLYTVNFTIKTVLNRGQAELTWQHDGDNYALGLLAKWRIFSLFEQTSVGRISPQGLLPTRFSDKRFRKSELAAHFDHAQGKISFSANTPDAVLQAGAQDRVSIILQLAGLLAADPANYPPNSTLNLQTVSAREAEPWLFTVNEPETLNLPEGPQLAVRLTRNPRREFDQKVELWFAPALNYWPVRFRFTESSGEYVDAQLQSSQSLPDAMPR
ncbi:MAG: DUF3108 domain-containing protein [Burkholderiaceae bacterium]|nr:DUF3108 domain-containing protein [Burkholderiaceae bacterium]